MLNTLKKYSTPLTFIGMALVFITFPLIAAFILSGLFLFIGIIWGWMIYRFHQYNQNQDIHVYRDFERDIYQNGGPSLKNVTVKIFRTDQFR
jgi:hypothetical protein